MRMKFYLKTKLCLLSMLMLTITAIGQKKTVYVVGGGTADAIQSQDQILIDYIKDWVDVVYVHQADFNGNASETKYDTIDGVIMLESCDSKQLTSFGNRDVDNGGENFPVPCITMEAGVVLADNGRWNIVDPDDGGIWGYGGEDCDDVDLEYSIYDPNHQIVLWAGDGEYEEGDVVVWSDHEDPTVYGIPYPHHLTEDIEIIAIASRDDPGDNADNAEFEQEEALTIFEIPDIQVLYMCAAAMYIEDNATDEFYALLEEAVYYMFDPREEYVVDEVNGVMGKKQLTLNIYPNPSNGMVNIIMDNANPSQVIVKDITGKVVDNFTATGNLKYKTTHLNTGVYFVSVNNETLKLIVE